MNVADVEWVLNFLNRVIEFWINNYHLKYAHKIKSDSSIFLAKSHIPRYCLIASKIQRFTSLKSLSERILQRVFSRSIWIICVISKLILKIGEVIFWVILSKLFIFLLSSPCCQDPLFFYNSFSFIEYQFSCFCTI